MKKIKSIIKKFLIAGVVLAVLVLIAEFSGLTDRFINSFGATEYTAPTTVEKIVEVSEKDQRIEAAQNAARANVEAEAQAAYDNAYNNAMTEIRAKVLKDMEAELRGEREEAEKEIGVY